jgi:hypothetical protein
MKELYSLRSNSHPIIFAVHKKPRPCQKGRGFSHHTITSAMLGIQQVIMLAELSVNRALDNLAPPG